jgi:hypothetical protein
MVRATMIARNYMFETKSDYRMMNCLWFIALGARDFGGDELEEVKHGFIHIAGIPCL